MPKTLIEPFRIKSVEPIRMTTRAPSASSCSRRRSSTRFACAPTTF